MIITFCGHAQLAQINREVLKSSIKDIIKQGAGGDNVTFYLGGYGDFDSIAEVACLEYKKEHGNCSLIFIAPYSDLNYLKSITGKNVYDEVMCPHIEGIQSKYAIVKRNEWMVDNSDLLIAYIDYSIGGAYKTFRYGQKKKIQTINLGHLSE